VYCMIKQWRPPADMWSEVDTQCRITGGMAAVAAAAAAGGAGRPQGRPTTFEVLGLHSQ
jgi:hypothetical protein